MLENYDKICKRFGGTAKVETSSGYYNATPLKSNVCDLPKESISRIRAVITPMWHTEVPSRFIALLPPKKIYGSDYDIESVNISKSTAEKYYELLGKNKIPMKQILKKPDGGFGSVIDIYRRSSFENDRGYYAHGKEQTLFNPKTHEFSDRGELIRKQK